MKITPGTAEVVIWGIKAGIRLAQESRQAYAEATIIRDLTLPLPNYNPEVSVGVAAGYFHGGSRVGSGQANYMIFKKMMSKCGLNLPL